MRPVPWVTQHRPSMILAVDTHLMCSTGFQRHLEEGGSLETFECFEKAERRPSSGHFGAEQSTIPVMPRMQCPPLAAVIGIPCHQHAIPSVYTVLHELPGQCCVSILALGNHHQPGSVLVQPVNNPRTKGIASSSRVTEQNAINQGTARMSGARMNHQTLGLVDYDEKIVFIPYIEGNGLRIQ